MTLLSSAPAQAAPSGPSPAPGTSLLERLVPLVPGRRPVKAAYTTRHAARTTSAGSLELLTGAAQRPSPGDLLVAEVTELGQHLRLEGPDSRRQTLFLGDHVLVAYGNRYAPDQFEGLVPADLGPVDLVAAGGLAARVLSSHEAMGAPTRLSPLGLLGHDGLTLTLQHAAPLRLRPRDSAQVGPRVVVVVGSSMNSGKTTTAASLVHGLHRGGVRVAAGKATGTGAGGDPRLFADAGACRVLDFTDFGFPSTCALDGPTVWNLFACLVDALAADDPAVIVVEVADGLFQQETARLLEDPRLAAGVDDVLFAATDPLGATGGLARLERLGLPVRAVTGTLTRSPLAVREAAASLSCPVIGSFDLRDPQVALRLLA